MEDIEIDCFTMAVATVYGDLEIKARWYGGAMVNIYFDGKEVDVYNDYDLKTKDDFEKSFESYIQYWLKENEDDDEEIS